MHVMDCEIEITNLWYIEGGGGIAEMNYTQLALKYSMIIIDFFFHIE